MPSSYENFKGMLCKDKIILSFPSGFLFNFDYLVTTRSLRQQNDSRGLAIG